MCVWGSTVGEKEKREERRAVREGKRRRGEVITPPLNCARKRQLWTFAGVQLLAPK